MHKIILLLSLSLFLLISCKGTQVDKETHSSKNLKSYFPSPIQDLRLNITEEVLQKQRLKLYPVSTQTPNTKEFMEDVDTKEIKSIQYYLEKAAETNYELTKVVVLYNTDIDPKEQAQQLFGAPNDNQNTSWYKVYDNPTVQLKAKTYRQKLEICLHKTNSSSSEEK
ncbi:MAG: hypothetical protein MK212_05285 [Saprospiraceae bacterium]|nr:hypothetical protein [Saprospiraceae bacterium]